MTEGRPTGPTGRTLIRDALIITVDDQDRVLDPGDLLIEDGRIAYVGPAQPDGAHRQGPFERDIDGRRLVVMPGFINAHTHTYATLFKGSYQQVPLDLWLIAMRAPTKLLSEELLELSALISGVEMLKSGTTTALDHFFGNPGLPQSGIGAEVRSMQRLGMRHAVACVDLGQPRRLADLVAAVPFRLAMDGLEHVVGCGVAAVVVGQVVALDRVVVAEEEMRLRPVPEPGIVVALQVPEMVMRIDQRHRRGLVTPGAVDGLHHCGFNASAWRSAQEWFRFRRP